MASKRPYFQEEEKEDGIGSLVPRPKRSRLWNLCYKEVIGNRFLENFSFQLETLLRGVVQEEVQKILLNYVYPSPRPSISQIQDAVRFQLHFQNRLPPTLFTGKGIKAEENMPIQIAIKDARNQIVTSGPLSSLKIKIVVIKDDFNNDGHATWSKEEFTSHILPERYGKRPLLTGELDVRMHNGVGCIVGVTFTDNSGWTRSKTFRLGAVVSESRYAGERVQEAITENFRVKDCRVESSQKDCPPSLNDEVCCLKKIKKDGAFHKKLMDSGIIYVQDFLRAHIMDPRRLRALLGRGMSNKWWEATLEHASQCALGNKRYSYCIVGQGIDLIFNSIYDLLGVKVCGLYRPVDDLSASLKGKMNRYKMLAYQNPEDMVEIHDYQNPEDMVEIRDSPLKRDIAPVPGSSLSDPHNFQHPAIFHDSSSSQVEFHRQAYASFSDLSSDMSEPIFHHLPQSTALKKADSFRRSSDKCTNLFITEPSTSLTSNVQATHDEAAKQVNCQVSSGQEFICVQRSASFARKKFSMNAVNDQNQGFQSHARTDCLEELNMSDEQLTLWITEMLQSPGAETRTHLAPSPPRKWVQLSAAFKLVSVIKRSSCRRARIAHPSHQAAASRA